jgi:hypothetical protein
MNKTIGLAIAAGSLALGGVVNIVPASATVQQITRSNECSYFARPNTVHNAHVAHVCTILSRRPAITTSSYSIPSGKVLVHECIVGYYHRSERELCILSW